MAEPKELNPDALSALKFNQIQCDSDGSSVIVSRQALDEMIEAYESLHEAWNEPCPKDHTPNAEIREPTWVEFVGPYGQVLRIRNRNVLAIHANADVNIKVVAFEYIGPVTYIEYGPTISEDGTGTAVRGSLDEVQAKLDGRA